MRDNPKPFEIFRHFKGKQYQILSLARDAGDGHDVVVYQALYGEYTVYVRGLAEFMSPVDRVKYPDASQEYRFERQCKMDAVKGTAADRVTGQGSGESLGQEPEKETEESLEQSPEKETGERLEQSQKKETGESLGQEPEIETEESLGQSPAKETEQSMEPAKEDSQEGFLDPMIVEFLDAESVYDKLNILAGLRHRITDDMLEIMATASDIELNEGSTQEKYAELKNCLLMMERYECKRIR